MSTSRLAQARQRRRLAKGASPPLGGNELPHEPTPIEPSGPPDVDTADAIADVARVRALLIAAARRRQAMSYSELLIQLGHRFTRPKMRALCRTLDAIDAAGAAAGEPDLAALVVREADGLPGQGWWVGRAAMCGYDGAWTGPDASRFVRGEQERAFAFWAARDRPAQ